MLLCLYSKLSYWKANLNIKTWINVLLHHILISILYTSYYTKFKKGEFLKEKKRLLLGN